MINPQNNDFESPALIDEFQLLTRHEFLINESFILNINALCPFFSFQIHLITLKKNCRFVAASF